ncbi:P2X purinoceptor 4a isoform X2 [Narcine bancroftii]|uniref:P2X purinoceptor 4a isoform X2 n=1 Tax=Narcine bancroftii TaxID=1343680 RepID=UPI0038320C3D
MKSCTSLCDSFLEYDTPRIVLIKNKTVGIVNRFIQLTILAYVVGWVFVWEKGYQEFDSSIASITTKVKGIAFTNSNQLEEHLWDAADYIIPVQQESSFFVMTNVIMTKNQVQGLCPELPSKTSGCKSDSDCETGYHDPHSNGILTGICDKHVNTCQVYGWCPVENDTVIPEPALLGEAENFTVFIKNSIIFPKFQFSKRNILTSTNDSYLKVCRFHPKIDPFCPIFILGDIVREAGEDFQKLAIQAGKFNIIPTMINIGSGLALLGMATIMCDIIILYFLKKKDYYKEKKYKYVEDDGLVYQ